MGTIRNLADSDKNCAWRLVLKGKLLHNAGCFVPESGNPPFDSVVPCSCTLLPCVAVSFEATSSAGLALVRRLKSNICLSVGHLVKRVSLSAALADFTVLRPAILAGLEGSECIVSTLPLGAGSWTSLWSSTSVAPGRFGAQCDGASASARTSVLAGLDTELFLVKLGG